MLPKHIDITMKFDTAEELEEAFNKAISQRQLALSVGDLKVDFLVSNVVCTTRQNAPAIVIKGTEKGYHRAMLNRVE